MDDHCYYLSLQSNYGNGQASPYGQYHHTNANSQQHHQPQSGSDWTNIIPTLSDSTHNANAHAQRPFKNSFTYTGNFVFYGLAPSTEYEVIIQSRNGDGWSDPNDIFRFRTRSRGKQRHK